MFQRDARSSHHTIPERSTNTLGASEQRHVLVVDADDDTRLLYRHTLELVRREVVEASDGRDALAKALVHVPSLVITELSLPFVNGFALCAILRRDRATAHVPILIVTAETRPAKLNRARHIADAVLTKPTMPDALANEAQRLMVPTNDSRTTSVVVTDGAAGTSPTLPGGSPEHRTGLAKAYSRFTTTTPSVAPPALRCPTCDCPLTYESSQIGGVNDRQTEQWDYLTCAICGTFQYRQRTRKLRRLHADEQQWRNDLKGRR